jgi:ABC-type transport system substrate-binding protein
MVMTDTMPVTANALSIAEVAAAGEAEVIGSVRVADPGSVILCRMDNGAVFRIFGLMLPGHSVYYRLHGTRGMMESARIPGGTLRVAMTSADVPTTGGIPNNGGEGNRFLGYTAYDALINWELAKNLDGIAGIRPGLATKWWVDEKDKTKWIFKLRQGVKFHDGTPLTVDAVIFNIGRIFDDKSPQFDAPASPIVRSQISMLDR